MRKIYGLFVVFVLLLFTSCPSPGFDSIDGKEISGNDYKLAKGAILYSVNNIGSYSENGVGSSSRAIDSKLTVYEIVNAISSTEEYLSSYREMVENPVADNSYYLSFSLETQFGKAQFSFDFVNEAVPSTSISDWTIYNSISYHQLLLQMSTIRIPGYRDIALNISLLKELAT